MPQPPEFITFTGVDDHTDIDEMAVLSAHYPIEWGVLMSQRRQGVEARYPSWETIQNLVVTRVQAKANGGSLTLSAHLCGSYTRELMETGAVRGVDAMLGRYFDRAQVNHRDPIQATVLGWSKRVGIQAITQQRDGSRIVGYPALVHPAGSGVGRVVQPLFDQSGGTGAVPSEWPVADPRELVGYAGGITHENVAIVVKVVSQRAGRYWIDMESGVRDVKDRFSLEKCREVCEAVYGRSLFQ